MKETENIWKRLLLENPDLSFMLMLLAVVLVSLLLSYTGIPELINAKVCA